MKIERWVDSLAIRIPEEMVTEFSLREVEDLSISINIKEQYFETQHHLHQGVATSGDTRIDVDAVMASVAANQRPYVSEAKNPSPFYYEKKQDPRHD